MQKLQVDDQLSASENKDCNPLCFIKAQGSLVKITLRDQEQYKVTTGALIGFESSVKYNV